jgi:hypothetical protein
MMARHGSLAADDRQRRAALKDRNDLFGIDFVEVQTRPAAENQRALRVFLQPKRTAAGRAKQQAFVKELAKDLRNVAIEGGVRVQGVKVTGLAAERGRLLVSVSEPGDFSTYVLRLRDPGHRLDAAYDSVPFSFKAGCPTRFDCKPRDDCPPAGGAAPPLDYMAKDYASFRQAMLDLLPTLAPRWTERHEADLGMALVDVIAYAADHLSYYQDAVANEAYLETARQRVSVRRHARFLDYPIHDGLSARAFVHVAVSADCTLKKGAQILTALPPEAGYAGHVVPADPPEALDAARQAADLVFETLEDADLKAALNHVPLYAWLDSPACIPLGSTSADLDGDYVDLLPAGSFLLLEEAMDPVTGVADGADRAHRQIVRITARELLRDKLHGGCPVTRVSWSPADALAFPLCVATTSEAAGDLPAVSVARGNLVLAGHGQTIAAETHPGPETPPYESQRRAHKVRLDRGPLSFVPIDPEPDPGQALLPAAAILARPEGRATPGIASIRVQGDGEAWSAVTTLLSSEPEDRDVAVETDNDGRAILRFGDGEYGMRPPDDRPPDDPHPITVTYRVGQGAGGNAGPDVLTLLVVGQGTFAVTGSEPPVPVQVEVLDVRNPLAAWGGEDPEPIERVKRRAPPMLRAGLYRAVTEEDYARVAQMHPDVSRAVATFRATRSWTTVFLAIDPEGAVALDPDLTARVKRFVQGFTQAGYDLEVQPPAYVALDLEIDVCVARDRFRADVERDLMDALSSRDLGEGRRGFFHPDNFSFGEPVYVSRIYAAIEAVPGVEEARITRFQRFGMAPTGELATGVAGFGRLEIARLDNDPDFPENGTLRLHVRGGK